MRPAARREAGTRSPPSPISGPKRAGRLYLTSLSILTLEVYYRYLPLYRTADDDKERMDAILKADDGPDDAPEAKKSDTKKSEPGKPKAKAKSAPEVDKPLAEMTQNPHRPSPRPTSSKGPDAYRRGCLGPYRSLEPQLFAASDCDGSAL